MATPIIAVEHLSKSYRLRMASGARYVALRDVLTDRVGGLFKPRGRRPGTELFKALDDVSFTVEPGARLGIIGRNGAGKSTLLKVLSRITEPSGGRVVLEGRVASLLEVGTGFHPELSGRENIFLNGAILGMGRAEIAAKFDEIVAFAEVERFLDTPVKRYSSGMYVRLAFAVAAHLEPEILIVDEHTGRLLAGRRYSEGLHQSLEAKEGVEIKAENQTLATITLQNYFRLYDKLSGMTGTAMTEANEFSQIYKLGVVPIPTNKPMIRADESDLVYRTEKAKYDAVVDDIEDSHSEGQPVLIGTVSVEKSEYLSQELRKRGIDHEVLNAKNHDREAAIVAQAGRKGAVTVATNMAGRGTDIMLGGNSEFMAAQALEKQGLSPVEDPDAYEAAWPDALKKAQEAVAAEHDEVIEAGGLYVLGTERHESRRIDNQLRGRSGRQGDPGETRFYLSLQDDLMRLFKADIVDSFLRRFNVPDDVPIEANMVTKAIASAQTQREAQNFEIRKDVLKYDDVLNRQRMVIYAERQKVLEGEDVSDQVTEFVEETVRGYVTGATGEGYPEDWDLEQLWTALRQLYPIGVSVEEVIESSGGELEGLTSDFLAEEIVTDALDSYAKREESLGEEGMREFERQVLLSVLDRKWREHLHEMDHLRHGIGLRAMAQRDPLVEYQKEGFDLFNGMMDGIKEESVGYLFNAEVTVGDVEDDEPALLDAGAATASAQLSELLAEGEDSQDLDEPTAPEIHAKGLGQRRAQQMQYSAPTAEGGQSVTTVGEADEEDEIAVDPNASRAERRRVQRARGKKNSRRKKR